MDRPLAVLSALPQELAVLRAAATGVDEVDLAPRAAAWRATLDGQPVILALTGIGKVATAMHTTALILRHQPRALVFTGVAGGLDPTLAVGDVIVADDAVQHDYGVAGADGETTYQPGHLPFFDPTDELGYAADPTLVEAATGLLAGIELEPFAGRRPRVVRGRVLSGDVFVDSAVMRRRLHAELGGRAVEMEGAALAQVAQAFGVPWLVIRALSDLAGAETPAPVAFTSVLDVAAANSARVVRRLLPLLAGRAADE